MKTSNYKYILFSCLISSQIREQADVSDEQGNFNVHVNKPSVVQDLEECKEDERRDDEPDQDEAGGPCQDDGGGLCGR